MPARADVRSASGVTPSSVPYGLRLL